MSTTAIPNFTALVEDASKYVEDTTVDAGAFRAGMRRLAGACTVIASRLGEKCAGLTATAVCSVSTDPARLLVCVNKSVRAHEFIRDSRLLSVNVLGEHQEEVAKRFAGMVINVTGEDRFAGGGTWKDGKLDVPLLEGALASFGCRVIEEIPGGASHTVFICDVIEVRCNEFDISPLVYFGGQFSYLGKQQSEKPVGDNK
jgi:flavin reductase (NADH)/flavin reductase